MIAAILVAGGKSTRMNKQQDKLLVKVAGKPLIVHTLLSIETVPDIECVVLAVPAGAEDQYRALCREFGITKNLVVVAGGPERQDSVWNGLCALPAGAGLVAVQDAARPCTSRKIYEAVLAAAEEYGGAVAASPVTDTLKASDDGEFISSTMDRSRLWAVQTPQAFKVDVLKQALTWVRARRLYVTDDAAACELAGSRVRLVSIDEPNPKVTYPTDLPYIEWLLSRQRREKDSRT